MIPKPQLVATALLAALIVSLGGGCRAPAERPNVVIISIDTLRADHLGCYGYGRDTSPELDRFAERSTRYVNAVAPAPWTLASHVALLSGRHPHEIGVRSRESLIPGDVQMLAESLQTVGYQTAAFVDSPPGGFVGAQRGFDRGFASYAHAPHSPTSDYRYDMAITVEEATHWLAQRDSARPFFLFLHTKSVHGTPSTAALRELSDAPYHKPEPYRTRFLGHEPEYSWTNAEGAAGVEYLRDVNLQIAEGVFDRGQFGAERLSELVALYDSGIFFVDHQVGRLLEMLDESGLAENTLIVVTADHGEAFLEHELLLHHEVFRPLIRVPLLVHYPNDETKRGLTIDAPVSLVDIAPTVLAAVDVSAPPAMTGRPLPKGDVAARDRRPLFSAYEYDDNQFYRAAALQIGRWKLVRRRLGQEGEFVVELFDLELDPWEVEPIHNQIEREAAMLQQLLEWLEAPVPTGGEQLPLAAETLDDLRALGYAD